MTGQMITPQRRELLLRVHDEYPPNLRYLWHIDQMNGREVMLRWLIDNRLTGKNFYEWIHNVFEDNVLDAMAHVLMRVKKDVTKRQIYFGKDYAPEGLNGPPGKGLGQ